MRLSRYQFGEFELDPASRELTRRGERIALPPKSFECLAYLIAHRDRAVGRDELIAAVWGRVEVSDTVVAQTMLRARKALDDAGDRQALVRTVPRFGYRWVAPVQEVAPGEVREPVDVVVAIASTPAPAPAPAPAPNASRTFAPWIVVASFALLAVVGWGAWRYFSSTTSTTAQKNERDVVLVLPVAMSPAGGDDAWVRLGAMDYVASRLRRNGMQVVPSEQTLHVSAQFGTRAPVDDESLRKVQDASDARWVIAPEASQDDRGWRMRFNLRDAGRPLVVEGRGATPLAAAAAATDAWLRRLGRNVAIDEAAPSALTERLQQVGAELFLGQLATARKLIEAAPAAQRQDPRLRLREGQLEFRAGRLDEATQVFAAVLASKPPIDDALRAQTLMGQGAVAVRRSQWAEGEALYTDALTLLERGVGEDPALLGNAYNGRGVARVQQGKMEAAVRDMGLARIAMQRSGDFVEAATVGSNLGQIETMRGHYTQALVEFDRAIAVFERFDVRDYLAATLMSKAETQLQIVQPSEAQASIARAAALKASVEDPYLASAIEFIRLRALLENGRLREAGAGIRARPARDGTTTQQLQLRWLLASGDRAGAATLARRMPNQDAPVPGSLALLAVEAALRNGDASTAQAWLARAPSKIAEEERTSWDLAHALVALAAGDTAGALQTSSAARARAEASDTPNARVQAGVLQARLLLADGQRDAAAAILGDLDAFGATDYRVAWTTLSLYRALGDERMADTALARVQALRGERDPRVEPPL